ncbi:MAG: PHP domain-containing protein [Bacillota bacterium]
MQLVADYHTHTRFSHGLGTVEQNVRAAWRKGLSAVGITDHGPDSLFIGMHLSQIDRLRNQAKRAEDRYGIKVLVGVEANVLSEDGTLDVPSAVLDRLDILLAGIHFQVVPRNPATARLIYINVAARFDERLKEGARELNTRALVGAVERYPIDIVTHPGLRADIDTAELAIACRRNGTALEINSSHRRMTPEYVRIAAVLGARFAIGSDAHSPQRVGDFESALRIAEAARLDARMVVNSREGELTEKHEPSLVGGVDVGTTAGGYHHRHERGRQDPSTQEP